MGKVYCSADWHGCYDVARKVMNYLQPDDKLYFLGDCCDRGDHGIKIFNELINDPRVTFLLGNHEQMMYDAIPYIIRDLNQNEIILGDDFETTIWFSNGGQHTAQAFYNMTVNEIHDIRSKIKTMPTKVEYTSPAGHTVILEHAGYSPFIIPHRTHDPVWDREHFYDDWDGGWGEGDPENTYLIHGHTPTMYLRLEYGYKGMEPLTKIEMQHRNDWWEEKNKKIMIPEVIRYCDGHKFCIDMCTIVSGRIALLDLDTFEVKYFDKE